MNKVSLWVNGFGGEEEANSFPGACCQMKKDKTESELIRAISKKKGEKTEVALLPNKRHFAPLLEFYRSLLLSFSPALDEHNPDIPEWREDVGRVVRTALSQVHQASITRRCFLPPAAFRLITISCRPAVLTEGAAMMLPALTRFIYLLIYLFL